MKKPKRKPKGNYKVGYAAPSAQHNFPKGKSGYPQGRAKKTAAMTVEELDKLLSKPITVKIKGRDIKISVVQAQVQGAIKNALVNKNLRSIDWILGKATECNLLPTKPSQSSGGVVILRRQSNVPHGMERMLAVRFGVGEPWTEEEIETVRPDFERVQKEADEKLKQMYREQLRGNI